MRSLIAVILLGVGGGAAPVRQDASLRLADGEFWQLVTGLSEETGAFPVGNLVSNESDYPANVTQITRTGGAYIGVGPEQNFSYIAALEPEISFIVDLRRPNRTLHLMYKAMFELSADRAAFQRFLFPHSQAAYEGNMRAVTEHLTRARGLAISDEELGDLGAIYQQFFDRGPQIRYTAAVTSTGQPIPGGGIAVSALPFSELMELTDAAGAPGSFLATEARFQRVRAAHLRNAIVPVTGDFAGTRTLRGVGAYLRQQGVTLSVFYGSNVQDYLSPRLRRSYCENLQQMPRDMGTLFLSFPTRRSTTLDAFVARCAR